MILVLDNYDSFTFNLVQLLALLGADVVVRRNDEIDADGFARLKPAALIVSPGPSHPDNAGHSAAIVRRALGREGGGALCPVLGVCLGHQVLARVFGAAVERAPAPVHGRASRIRHDGAGVFVDVPQSCEAARYHSLAVVEETLPDELRVTARSEDGVVMGIRHTTLRAEGVQFHPESILTPAGETMVANFLRGLR